MFKHLNRRAQTLCPCNLTAFHSGSSIFSLIIGLSPRVEVSGEYHSKFQFHLLQRSFQLWVQSRTLGQNDQPIEWFHDEGFQWLLIQVIYHLQLSCLSLLGLIKYTSFVQLVFSSLHYQCQCLVYWILVCLRQKTFQLRSRKVYS